MRLVITFLIYIWMMSAVWATVQTSHPCQTLLQIERFSNGVHDRQTHASYLNADGPQIEELRSALADPAAKRFFSPADQTQISKHLNAAVQYSETARELSSIGVGLSAAHKNTNPTQLTNLVKRYGCSAISMDSDGSDWTAVTQLDGQAATEAGTDADTGTDDGMTLYSFSAGAILLPLFVLLSAVSLLVFLMPSRNLRRIGRQLCCHTQSLLVFGDNCTVTPVLSIGERGAKLQAPTIDIASKTVELAVAGHKILAKQDWVNRYYIGLVFVQPISEETVASIVKASQEKDQLSIIGKNATDCFSPGCHLSCRKHRITELSMRETNAGI